MEPSASRPLARARVPKLLLGLSAVFALHGCSCGPTPTADADAGVDGGPVMPDAGADDAGFDGGAAMPDAGVADAGVDGGPVMPDAGAADAGAADAGAADAGCLGLPGADGGCAPLSLSGLCALARFNVVLDGNPDDDDAGLRMAAALHAGCDGGPALRAAHQDGGGIVDAYGVPLVGPNELVVCGGGSFLQRHVAWLESRDVLQVRDTQAWPYDAGFELRDGGVLVSVPLADFDGGFDYFAIELLRPGPQFPLTFTGAGFFAEGTAAAGLYVERFIAPDAGRLELLWQVVKWTDANRDGRVGLEDAFEVVAQGR